MKSTEARSLSIGARICWEGDRADQGTVTERDRGGVRIEWDNGHKSFFPHIDMKEVSVVPKH